jgi:hypothetical protein
LLLGGFINCPNPIWAAKTLAKSGKTAWPNPNLYRAPHPPSTNLASLAILELLQLTELFSTLQNSSVKELQRRRTLMMLLRFSAKNSPDIGLWDEKYDKNKNVTKNNTVQVELLYFCYLFL